MLMLAALAVPARGADVSSATYYIQLVRGSDLESTPTPHAKLIGPKLDRRLHDCFKWKNYWEINRQTVTLKTGAKVRQRISPQREVEISWPTPGNVVISLYNKGKLTRKREQPVDTGFYIAGGDTDADECWFVIVRRDNPDSDPVGFSSGILMP